MPFSISKFRNAKQPSNRYQSRIEALKRNGISTNYIEEAVKGVVGNVNQGVESLVVYGEPQSGKTEMMIALTAKLLDEGRQIVVELLNDNLQLRDQNLERFQKSGLNPTPIDIADFLEEKVGQKQWVVFCKKNSNDLSKLISHVGHYKGLVVVDDEADYASPNSKINRNETTKINTLIGKLLRKKGTYIGVTATPARLDLNNTFDNLTEKWVEFGSHEHYVGKDIFFPLGASGNVEYSLEILPDIYADAKHLRTALLSFLVNVAYINLHAETRERWSDGVLEEDIPFTFLVHTSGKKDDHADDARDVNKVFDVLSDKESAKFEQYARELYEVASKKTGDEEFAEQITLFVIDNINRKKVTVLNSKRKSSVDPTDPPALFSVTIGGNIVSRGVTFNNLLGMFFTRDSKHKLQQDTYIQRARMFGNRKKYLSHFELTIPESLYDDWHRCFVYHHLSLESIRNDDGAPIWLADSRIQPAAGPSIDKRHVVTDQGEMSFAIFEYNPKAEEIIHSSNYGNDQKLNLLHELVGEKAFPEYLVRYVKVRSRNISKDVAFLGTRNIGKETQGHDTLTRRKGFIGGDEISRYPDAVHYIKILVNENQQARILYKASGAAKFIKNTKNA